MNQLLKNFISLGNTGNICYLLAILKDLDLKDDSIFKKQIKNLISKKVDTLVLIVSSEKEKNQYNSLIELLKQNGIQCSFYLSNSDIKTQVELFESIVDFNKFGNIAIVYAEFSTAVIELAIKLLLYVNPSLSIEEVYSYFSNKELDIVSLNEFKEYMFFLENDPYLITKPDRREFNKHKPKPQVANGAKSVLPSEELKSTSEFTLNLSSLKNPTSDDEKLLTETEKLNFNLNSLVESDFEKEESPEEHYEKLSLTAHREVDDSLSLDVDLSEEIEYISSLENLSPPTKEKISIVEIETVPLDSEFESTKIPNPTIDYKNKQYIDFDAIIEEEIEQGMLSADLGIDLSEEITPTQNTLNLDDFIADDKEDMFSFEDHIVHTDADSAINLDIMDTKANIDLSFPSPLPDLEDLLEEEMELETEVTGGHESLVDPSQTFMVKRINDVIKKEVLNDDSKGKIPVSDLTKIDTKTTEATPQKSNPTLPQISSPKISNPKFNPITLDD